ncbi:histidine phosphatase family protein [Paenibacillus motobuensis]|uniref:histidine phosphatase family protein n=1 Tax=Paenibacillus TaxID=44249 RepID=UPI00203FD66D|nr:MULTISPECIES: histidine phosphatase family protein [Paenibacillus]MCM3040132.1 histidine phosphatase family protein [Paenibacillus lutimineralis]MCM3647236.1 histidine phosphatase family protein [Paenibacillus motobuensis]
MLVGLVRHGLTDWNKIGRIQGQSDIPLNEEGRSQARKLSERLLTDQEYKWDFVITSGLSRAQETGEIIAKTLNIPLYDPDSRLVEKAFGQVEGLTAEERETLWGVDWKQLDLGQESDEAIQDRALSFLKEMGEKYSDNNVLVVSHGGLLAQLFTALYQNKCTERIGNLSLTILEKNDHNWDMRLYNCTRHLEDI